MKANLLWSVNMVAKACRLSFTDLEGLRHSVEVQAESPYEAAVFDLKALQKSAWVEAVGRGTRLEIQVAEPAAVYFCSWRSSLDGCMGRTNLAELVRKRGG